MPAPSVRSSEHLLTRPHVSTVVVLHPPETEQADHRDQPAQLFFCFFFWLGSNARALGHRLVDVVVDRLKYGAWIWSLSDRTAND